MPTTVLNVGLDLGSDTLKIAYAYEVNGKTCYGKLMQESLVTQVAIPAVAFFDVEEGRWLFGDEVDKHLTDSFVTVVKIKSLLNLLSAEGESFGDSNREYFYNGNRFPKFYFPERRKMKSDFSEMVKSDMTFSCDRYTPQMVCDGFFSHASKIAEKGIEELAKKEGIEFSSVRYALVHHSRMPHGYVEELTTLVSNNFDQPYKILSSTKALSMYAYYRGKLNKGENMLIFDMGEERISVAKASITEMGEVAIDGAEGHNAPTEIGGNDIDDRVSAFIEDGIFKSENPGTPSYGEEGHIVERGLHSKQFLLMKEIKRAKIALSMNVPAFAKGVPIAVHRELYFQRTMTKEQFCRCIGTSNSSGIARAIVTYVKEEVKRPTNKDVTKILLSGGLTETLSLVDHIKAKVGGTYEYVSFDDNVKVTDVDDNHTILSHEDSTYAPAVGGAIVAMKNYDVATVVSLSYGAWVASNMPNGTQIKTLGIFLDRGTHLPEKGKFFSTRWRTKGLYIEKEEIFSTVLTKNDISKKKYSANGLGSLYRADTDGSTVLVIDEYGTNARRILKDMVSLETILGGANLQIKFYYSGRQVSIDIPENEDGVLVKEGVYLDPEGNATPQLINDEAVKSRRVSINYVDGKYPYTERVYSSDIEFVFWDISTNRRMNVTKLKIKASD